MAPRFLSVRLDEDLARSLDRVTTLARERFAHAHVSTSAVARRALSIGLGVVERDVMKLIAMNGRGKKKK